MHDPRGHGLVVANRDQIPGLAVDHHFGNRPAAVATAGFRGRHRVDECRARAFDGRAHHEQVESLRQLQRVVTEAGQKHVALEVLVPDLILERCRSSPSPTMTKRTSGT